MNRPNLSEKQTLSTAEILRDLARARAVFQLRAIEAVIKGGSDGFYRR